MTIATSLKVSEKELREVIADWLVNKLDQSQIGDTDEIDLAKMLEFSLDKNGRIEVAVSGLTGEL